MAGGLYSAVSEAEDEFIFAEGDGDDEEKDVAVERWEGAGLAPRWLLEVA